MDRSVRKSTPPDLLALSNMYYDRQHSLMGDFRISESAHEQRSNKPAILEEIRPATSEDAASMAAATGKKKMQLMQQQRANRMLKLAPLARPSEEIEDDYLMLHDSSGGAAAAARRRSNTHGLHLSVNFTSQGWRKALDPLGSEPSSSAPIGDDDEDDLAVKGYKFGFPQTKGETAVGPNNRVKKIGKL